MAIIENTTNFTVTAAETFEEESLIIILPENDGINALRELHYPDDILPPIIYEQNPDKYENFDSVPLTNRPILAAEQTIEGNVFYKWDGYVGDRPVKEIWTGDEKVSHMTAYFLRRLLEYVLNPPTSGYIEWWPKDRTTAGYYIVIESLAVGGAEIGLNYLAMRNQDNPLVMGNVEFMFRIVSEIP